MNSGNSSTSNQQLFITRTAPQGATATNSISYSHSAGKAKNPECSSSSSSSSSGFSSPDSDAESKRLRAALARKPATARGYNSHQDAPLDGAGSSQTEVPRPRRAASAGPSRIRSSLLPTPSAIINSIGIGASATNGTAAFVRTTTSLIRAQRVSNGQTLTESANLMLATMDATNNKAADHEVERDESVVFAPPVQTISSSSGSGLKSQRSTSQLLPQTQSQQQQQQDPKKLPKRLTVPKSPKFSVMSWQKKRSGNGPIRPSSAAAASTATTTSSASAATAVSIAATARK